MPDLGSELFHFPANLESPFIYREPIGYEPKPYAAIESVNEKGKPKSERLNSEGFRGPEYQIPKPPGTFRILALGDSVVHGATKGDSLSYAHTWTQQLEQMLNRRFEKKSPEVRCEVMNAGVGGYVSWQAKVRLQKRGLKYQPDLVLVLVGWNDLIFSSLPFWTPSLEMSKIEKAYWRKPNPEKKGLWGRIRLPLYRASYGARFIRQARNTSWNAQQRRKLVQDRQRASGLPFNEEALKGYRKNLEEIYQILEANGSWMGLIVWPTLLRPELFDHSEVHKRLLVIYSNFPLSTREIWDWYQRYAEAQREFAKEHPDVILVDAARAFQETPAEEHLRLFTDLSHITQEGNRRLAEVVAEGLIRESVVP